MFDEKSKYRLRKKYLDGTIFFCFEDLRMCMGPEGMQQPETEKRDGDQNNPENPGALPIHHYAMCPSLFGIMEEEIRGRVQPPPPKSAKQMITDI